mmetsp:Transcript_9931/g.12352  ORF Transcript_9931/g.12352 Transcript_9931/m.12352 type:complete len:149 (+) Transcript_9931:3478-3924(+)
MRAISVGDADYMANSSVAFDEESSEAGQTEHRGFSINITEEALRIGKLPTEQVSCNIAKNKYNNNGILKGKQGGGVSPRICEMIQISKKLKDSFSATGEAPETTTEFYRAGKMLGRGAFGKVNLGMHKLTRKLIAIKSINQEYLTDDK